MHYSLLPLAQLSIQYQETGTRLQPHSSLVLPLEHLSRWQPAPVDGNQPRILQQAMLTTCPTPPKNGSEQSGYKWVGEQPWGSSPGLLEAAGR